MIPICLQGFLRAQPTNRVGVLVGRRVCMCVCVCVCVCARGASVLGSFTNGMCVCACVFLFVGVDASVLATYK